MRAYQRSTGMMWWKLKAKLFDYVAQSFRARAQDFIATYMTKHNTQKH